MTGFDSLGNIVCGPSELIVALDNFELGFAQPPWQVVTFGSNTFNVGWGVFLDGSHVLQGEGGVSTGGGSSIAYRTDFEGGDFAVEAKVKVQEVRNGGHQSAIVGRFVDEGDFYELAINKFQGALFLMRWVSGAVTFLGGGGISLPQDWFDTWVTLRLEFEGNRLKAYANGVLYIDVTDDAHAAGSAGLMNSGGVSRYDDFSVSIQQ